MRVTTRIAMPPSRFVYRRNTVFGDASRITTMTMTSKRPVFTTSSAMRQSHHRSRLPHTQPNTRQCHHRRLVTRTNGTIAKSNHMSKNKKVCHRADGARNNTHPSHSYRNNNNNLNDNGKNVKSAAGDAEGTAAETAAAAAVDPPPTARQLMIHAIRTSIPMIGT